MNTWVANAADELIDARLQTGDAVRFTIPTWSMYPALAPGDQVIVRRARVADLRVGDVVIVKGDASAVWVAHRLIARHFVEGTWRLVTKGDNCATADPP
ncbi:MAG: signal peptidase I, partial [Anaerolineales bacterium]|nr:signal peptidase I [Anaerolineales bacterium]